MLWDAVSTTAAAVHPCYVRIGINVLVGVLAVDEVAVPHQFKHLHIPELQELVGGPHYLVPVIIKQHAVFICVPSNLKDPHLAAPLPELTGGPALNCVRLLGIRGHQFVHGQDIVDSSAGPICCSPTLEVLRPLNCQNRPNSSCSQIVYLVLPSLHLLEPLQFRCLQSILQDRLDVQKSQFLTGQEFVCYRCVEQFDGSRLFDPGVAFPEQTSVTDRPPVVVW